MTLLAARRHRQQQNRVYHLLWQRPAVTLCACAAAYRATWHRRDHVAAFVDAAQNQKVWFIGIFMVGDEHRFNPFALRAYSAR